MAQLRHRATGVVVNVSDDTAKRIAADYEPVKSDKPAPKKAPAKSDDK